jgi:hypothetical protein
MEAVPDKRQHKHNTFNDQEAVDEDLLLRVSRDSARGWSQF